MPICCGTVDCIDRRHVHLVCRAQLLGSLFSLIQLNIPAYDAGLLRKFDVRRVSRLGKHRLFTQNLRHCLSFCESMMPEVASVQQ